MSLAARVTALAQAVAADIKNLLTTRGNLANLQTAEKSNLVGALNELKGLIGSAGAAIDDAAASGTTTYSSTKINAQITQAVNDLVNGAPAALNTLLELANELTTQDGVLDGVVAALANRVGVEAQSFTAPQQAQARSNIGAASSADMGDPETDFAAQYAAAKA